MSIRSFLTLTAATAVVFCVVMTAQADPYPNQVLKFDQEPMIDTLIGDPLTGVSQQYFGHDESSTARYNPSQLVYSGTYMADDFADTFNSPVVHLQWWGSYLSTDPVTPDFVGAQRFLIAWETDVPGDATAPSHPGQVIQSEIVRRVPLPPATPPAGSFTEQPVRGSSTLEPVYVYNAELAIPFDEKADTVYWLKIVALNDPDVDGGIFDWGWHNRDYTLFDPLASPNVVPGEHIEGVLPDGTSIWHFQDDAVTGGVVIQQLAGTDDLLIDQPTWAPTHYLDLIDGPASIGQYSKDLAFRLYTVPEPASLALAGLGGVMVLLKRRNSRC